jgi:uncharacterized paraquat-inducible protein A
MAHSDGGWDGLEKERSMARCPVCESMRIVVVVSSERRAFCARCGARWVQDGIQQRNIQSLAPLPADPTTATPA